MCLEIKIGAKHLLPQLTGMRDPRLLLFTGSKRDDQLPMPINVIWLVPKSCLGMYGAFACSEQAIMMPAQLFLKAESVRLPFQGEMGKSFCQTARRILARDCDTYQHRLRPDARNVAL